MKRAPRLSCQSSECDHSSEVYSENSILFCDSCTRPICVHCAAGLPNEISLSKTEEMITLYKSVGSIFVCHECKVLKRQKRKAHTHDWGVLSFFCMKHVTLQQIQAAESFSFSSLTRRRFPNGSSAISAVLDRSANAVCAVGNYGSATGTPSDVCNCFALYIFSLYFSNNRFDYSLQLPLFKYRILTRQTNSFGLNKVDQKELKTIINAQLGGNSLPHRILLLLPYVPFSKSKEFTDHLSPREILCLRRVLLHSDFILCDEYII
jgi:hypothetical protein